MKGLSPLVATVLLIVMVVAISAIIISSTTSLTKSATGEVENRTQASTGCAGASIKIDDVFITNGTAGSARVHVRNDGLKDDLAIVSGQLYNSTGHNFTASDLPLSNFDRGNIVTVTFSNISVTTCANFSHVTITTDCSGAYDTFSKTPKCL